MKTKVLHEQEDKIFDKNFLNNQNYILGKKEKIIAWFLNLSYKKNDYEVSPKLMVYLTFPPILYILISNYKSFFTETIFNIFNIIFAIYILIFLIFFIVKHYKKINNLIIVKKKIFNYKELLWELTTNNDFKWFNGFKKILLFKRNRNISVNNEWVYLHSKKYYDLLMSNYWIKNKNEI